MFHKGQSGNPNGRGKGSENNVNKEVKAAIAAFVVKKFSEVDKIWDKLTPTMQARLLVDLLPYVASRMKEQPSDDSEGFKTLADFALHLMNKN